MWIKNVLIGALFAAFLHLLISSSCIEQITNPDDNNTEKAVLESVGKASDIFLSGDTTQLKTILTNDALKFYDGDFVNIMQVMKDIGTGMKEKSIKSMTDLIAEVEITYQGKQFIILMAKQDDETWKIIRF